MRSTFIRRSAYVAASLPLIVGILVLVLQVLPKRGDTSECLSLDKGLADRLTMYVAQKYELAPDLSIDDTGTEDKTCFRKLTFTSGYPRRTLTMFLSPDQRYLTADLLDTKRDPRVERTRVAIETQERLLKDPSPEKGPSNAEVTIVEFSDFECPFCGRFEEFVNQLPTNGRSVRIIYKHLPLPAHPWARKAALASTCANIQNSASFWKMHDFFFRNQEKITPETFETRLREFLSRNRDVNENGLYACMHQKDTERKVDRDLDLAELYKVTATPTVFVNGVRKPGFRSALDLKNAVTRAVVLPKIKG